MKAIRRSSNVRRLVAVVSVVMSTGPLSAQDVGNPEAGAEVFKKCMACHRVGPGAKNGVGPALNGVVGRPAGFDATFNYTKANKESGLTWDVPTLTRYLKAPKEVVPGTKMAFNGLPVAKDVADLIAYLASFDAAGNKVAPK